MAGRKIRDAQDARACLAEAAESELTRAEWARSKGINARSLNAWRLNLARGSQRAGEPGRLRLIELVAPSPVARDEGPGTSAFRVRCGPFVVEVDAGFDEHALRRLLATVAGC
jgi:hypothetical protein